MLIVKKEEGNVSNTEGLEHRVAPSSLLSLSPEITTVTSFRIIFQIFHMHPQTYICFIFLYSGIHTVHSPPQLACFHLL